MAGNTTYGQEELNGLSKSHACRWPTLIV